MIESLTKNSGSFRDPAGYVYEYDNKIYRLINEIGRKEYEHISQQGIFNSAIAAGYLIASKEIDSTKWPADAKGCAYLLEHERIPYVSYPYEWSFYHLKQAALHHLDFQLWLFKHNIALKDASAYNVQFRGAKPVFIDLLSLTPYREGDFWLGHSQFCEQFLNPLLLRSTAGVSPNNWFRGRMEGIATSDLARLIPFHKRFNWNVFSHVLLQAKLEKSAIQNQDKAIEKTRKIRSISKLAYEGFLCQLRNWIAKLEPRDTGKTFWGNYTETHTYANNENEAKRQFIAEFVKAVQPEKMVDLGCNTGDYSILALEHGAKYVVGFDFDQSAVEFAFGRSQTNKLPFLPLLLDAANPSPNQGWLQSERHGFAERTKSDALIALAFIHHLAIAKNIPLAELIDWLINIAPQGVIEFIPKDDSTIVKMLSLREDIFSEYHQDYFELLLLKKAKIIKQQCISAEGRTLYWYEKN